MVRWCNKKTKTAAFIIFVSACAGFAVVLIVIASAQLSNGMPLLGTAAFGMSVMCLVCCYDPEELEAMSSGGGGTSSLGGTRSSLGYDDEEERFRQSAKDNGAVFSGILLSGGMGINVLLWRYSRAYSTGILILTLVGNTLLLAAIISIVWIFCFATRIWSGPAGTSSTGGSDEEESGVGTVDW